MVLGPTCAADVQLGISAHPSARACQEENHGSGQSMLMRVGRTGERATDRCIFDILSHSAVEFCFLSQSRVASEARM